MVDFLILSHTLAESESTYMAHGILTAFPKFRSQGNAALVGSVKSHSLVSANLSVKSDVRRPAPCGEKALINNTDTES